MEGMTLIYHLLSHTSNNCSINLLQGAVFFFFSKKDVHELRNIYFPSTSIATML